MLWLLLLIVLLQGVCWGDAHAPTLVEIAPGRLGAAWYGGSTSVETRCNFDPQGEMVIWFSTFSSGEWSEAKEVARSDLKCWNPVLFAPKEGELLLFYKVGRDPRSWIGLVRRSTDQGESWSDPELLPAGIIGPTRNRPLISPSGEWLCGSSWEGGEPDDPLKAAACWIEISADRGATWSKVGPIVKPGDPFGIIQPALFPTQQGLSLYARDRAARVGGRGPVWRSDSSDGGRSWSPPRPTALPCPDQPVDIIRLRDGRHLLAYNNAPDSRNNLTLSLSDDDGESWSEWQVVEGDSCDASYPSLVEAADGKIHLIYSYSWTEEGERSLRHRIFELKSTCDKDIVSE